MRPDSQLYRCRYKQKIVYSQGWEGVYFAKADICRIIGRVYVMQRWRERETNYTDADIAHVKSISKFDMLYLCICVFVFLYLHVRNPGTLFFESSYHYLFKNISHDRSI